MEETIKYFRQKTFCHIYCVYTKQSKYQTNKFIISNVNLFLKGWLLEWHHVSSGYINGIMSGVNGIISGGGYLNGIMSDGDYLNDALLSEGHHGRVTI